MNRSQLEHIIRAASAIADDDEVIVIGSQAIHAQIRNPPAEAMPISEEDRVHRQTDRGRFRRAGARRNESSKIKP